MPKSALPVPAALSKSQSAELDKIAKFIREQHPLVKMDFSNLTFRRFAIGCYLLRARAILPDGKDGPKTGDESNAITFVKWKHQQFPDLSSSTLYDYQSFATRALEKFPELEGFEITRSVSDAKREEILAQLKQCVNGKDQTLFLRAMGEIPEATPAGGDRGGRRPKKDIAREHRVAYERAQDAWTHLCDELDREDAQQSWKLVEPTLRERILRSLAIATKIREYHRG